MMIDSRYPVQQEESRKKLPRKNVSREQFTERALTIMRDTSHAFAVSEHNLTTDCRFLVYLGMSSLNRIISVDGRFLV